MVKNESTIDRGIRGVVGAILVLWAVFGAGSSTVLYVIALIVGVVLLATAIIGFCPIYKALGFSTKK